MNIHELLKQMTLTEKVGQLAQLSPFFLLQELEKEAAGPIRELDLNEQKIFSIGSILGIGSAEDMIKVQTRYLEKSRLRIPLLFMGDIIHGYKTIFPVPLGLAASFNPECARETARVSAREASVAGLHMTFSPMADLVRDPRWGRVVESFGESKHLLGAFAAAMVEGYQTPQPEGYRLSACVKHFAAYGAAEAGMDYNTVDISRLSLHNHYLAGYREAIRAGAKGVMTAFNVFEGLPCTINDYLLKDVLRDNLGFTGVTISDYASLFETISHGVALDLKDAARRGLSAGLDIEMASVAYLTHLEKLVAAGEVSEALLDDAVLRILRLKAELGLFDNPFRGADLARQAKLMLHPDHLASAETVAKECLVLLENNGVLPLVNTTTLALIGPFATAKRTSGPWSWHGYRDENTSLAEALARAGCHLLLAKSGEGPEAYDEADYRQIRDAEVVILYLGEAATRSGEARSLTDIGLPHEQLALYGKIRELGKKTVVLLQNGRPLLLAPLAQADAILETWFLGSRAAEAIAATLLGENNPSGKLPMTFPRNMGQIPIYHDRLRTGRPLKNEDRPGEFEAKYLDSRNSPLYPFAHGKSYSRFESHDLSLSKHRLTSGELLEMTINITNHGPRSGMATVLVYLSDPQAKISRPVQELIKFKKVHLEAGETQAVSFTITLADLTYHLGDGTLSYDPGKFTIRLGLSPTDLKEAEFTLL